MFASHILSFWRRDSGAVTVDWVVLTAAVVGIGLASAAAVRTGTTALGNDIQTSLDSASVATLDLSGTGGTVGVAADQCPSDWTDQVSSLYGTDVADLESDVEFYDTLSDAELIDSLDRYTREGGFGVRNNEDNVQTISCVLAGRGISVDVRVL